MSTQRTLSPVATTRGTRVTNGLLRLAWGRRLECGLTLVAYAARVTLAHLLGVPAAAAVLALSTGALVAHAPARRFVTELARRQRAERVVGGALAATGVLGGREAQLEAVAAVPAGQQLSLWVPPGTTVGELQRGEELLAVAFRARSVRVVRDPACAAHAMVSVSYLDTLAGGGFAWPWLEARATDFWAPFPLGYDEDGAVVGMALSEHHLLVGGEPGAGKSNALSVVVATAALDPTAQLWLFDGKRVELSAWRAAATSFVGADVEEATEALHVLKAEMAARFDRLEQLGLRKVQDAGGIGAVVVVVDELALYLHGTGKAGTAFAEALRDLVALGRAAGIIVVAATQKPAADVVPTFLRDLFGYRLAMRCATRDASDTVLGSGWATAGYSASEIDPATRGVGLLLAEGGVPRRLRAFHLDDEALATLAARAALVRVGGAVR